MNEKLKEQLLAEQSKMNVNYIVDFVKDKEECINDLVQFTFNEKEPVNSRASWVLIHLSDLEKKLILPYINFFVENINLERSDAVKRNILRILSAYNIDKNSHSFMTDLCFEILISVKEKVAAKVHAMQILYNLSEIYSDLKPELQLVLQEEIKHNSIAFENRAKKIIKKLNKHY